MSVLAVYWNDVDYGWKPWDLANERYEYERDAQSRGESLP